jgi:hypothetical protein
MPSVNLLEAVAVTAELCGRVFTEAAARVFVNDLSAYPEDAVIKALARCRKEVRGVLTVQDVVSRIDDGRPGPEEAWAMLPLSESQSAVWTDEMASAWSVSQHLLDNGDKTGARFAFKEAYIKRVDKARDQGKRVNWTPTLGTDPHGRERVLTEAVAAGRLPLEYAQQFVPHLEAPKGSIAELLEAEKAVKRITA